MPLPRDFVDIAFALLIFNRRAIPRTTTWGQRRICRPISLRIKIHGNELTRVVFIARAVVADGAFGPRVVHVPVGLCRLQWMAMMIDGVDGDASTGGDGGRWEGALNAVTRSSVSTSRSPPKQRDRAGNLK